MGVHHVDQAASASQSAGITGVSHRAQPITKSFHYFKHSSKVETAHQSSSSSTALSRQVMDKSFFLSGTQSERKGGWGLGQMEDF